MTMRHEMLWIGDGVGLNSSDTVRVPMMDLFYAKSSSDLIKEWANILDMVKLMNERPKLAATCLEKHWTRVVYLSINPIPITIK